MLVMRLAALAAALALVQPAAVGPLDAVDRDARAGVYGNVDHLLVVRKGTTIIDARYSRDYQVISRGARGPIGCGFGCTDSAWWHQFNYFHPDWHPYYRNRGMFTPCSRSPNRSRRRLSASRSTAARSQR